jgi:hypothetical protein
LGEQALQAFALTAAQVSCTVFQLRLVAKMTSKLSVRAANLDLPMPSGV